jgi:precorrin-4/cobalt-precorrin-4 C11-methyltransferase
MKVYFVGAGPGDPDLITVKGLNRLKSARCCVYAGSLVNPDVLRHLPADAERHDSAGMTLEQVIEVCRAARERGVDVVRLHSGEPAIYGAIGEQMRELDKLGIDYEVIPGISAFQAAAAALRKELTSPEVSQTVILTRTAGRTPMPAGQELSRLASIRATLCIYLSTPKIAKIAEVLSGYYGADCPAAVGYHVSWPDQKMITGTLRDIGGKVAQAGFGKTAIILAGPALGDVEHSSKLYDRHFSHEFRRGEPA